MVNVSATNLTAKAREVGIPAHMIDGLVQYILIGRPVGHFLTAVLSGHLFEAIHRADETNQHKLYEYVFYLYNYAPAGCFGSYDHVVEWIKHQGLLFKERG